MKILNFGSVNIDYIFLLDHIVRPGETITSNNRKICPGGKGLNQSIALAKAGIEVYHAGMIGNDGKMLRQVLEGAGVSTKYLQQVDELTGNAIIQVDQYGQNSIVLYPGANHLQTIDSIRRVLSDFESGDLLLIQNEINLLDVLIEMAYERGMIIALNPSPFDSALESCDMSKVSIFILNEVEGQQLTGEKNPNMILNIAVKKYPRASIVLTLGDKGVLFGNVKERLKQPAYRVEAIDTTAAGDTFTGYFLAAYMHNLPTEKALRFAAAAAAISVCQKGASSSIPTWEQVEEFLCIRSQIDC